MNPIKRSYGAVAIPVTQRGTILAIPYLDENHGKKEGLAWAGETKDAVGMQYPGGASNDETETTLNTITREWEEETKFKVEKERFEQLPIGTAILQEGGSRGKIWFGVELFRLILTDAEEFKLRENGAVEINQGNDVRLRPRDEVIGELYFATHGNMETMV